MVNELLNEQRETTWSLKGRGKMVDLISGINTNKLQILESIWGNVRVELGVM